MVTLNKIYTKAGDKGETSLGDGTKVKKNHSRVCAFGSVDELNSSLGVAILYIPEDYSHIKKTLQMIQNDLFDCGGDLCVPETDKDLGYEPLRMSAVQTLTLEKELDALNAELSPLRSFILPSGSVASSYLHVSRSIARRAERDVITLITEDNAQINPHLVTYLNRLSDYLFVVARYLNDKGQADILWVAGKNLKGVS